MSVHEGHRERLKQRFLKDGLDGFTEIQVLELLLFYCIPRRDTNAIAHELLERFGSFYQVMEAPTEELKQVSGVGEHAAVFLNLITQTSRYYMRSMSDRVELATSLEECAQLLLPNFVGRTAEMVFLLCLDAKCKVLSCRKISEGNVNTAAISVRKVVETALVTNAASVVLAHNHPGGLALPSREDVETTAQIAAALKAVGVYLADHIIVADNDYVSLAQSGYHFEEQMGSGNPWM